MGLGDAKPRPHHANSRLDPSILETERGLPTQESCAAYRLVGFGAAPQLPRVNEVVKVTLTGKTVFAIGNVGVS